MKTRPQAFDQSAFEQKKEGTFDVCVIGGGASGASCALDAQLRGLRTVLAEAGDFGSGSSSTA
jgi:glycerol-3-phosphate dehydrogenase